MQTICPYGSTENAHGSASQCLKGTKRRKDYGLVPPAVKELEVQPNTHPME